jgi:hypothetical protein
MIKATSEEMEDSCHIPFSRATAEQKTSVLRQPADIGVPDIPRTSLGVKPLTTSAISNTPAQARPADAAAAPQKSEQPSTDSKKAIQSNAQHSVDKATISSAAKAALLEATETAAQTAKEARGGDRQAQHLLAKQAAAKTR